MNYILIASIISIVVVGILLTIYFIRLQPNIDCKMSEWSTCDPITLKQNRSQLIAKSGNGATCGNTTQDCIPNVDCQMSEWSTCDFSTNKQKQTRNIVVANSGTGNSCPTILEKICNYILPSSFNWELVYDNTTNSTIVQSKEYVDTLFSKSGILKRTCDDCNSLYKEIYYKRITPIPVGFSIYTNIINTWGSLNNSLNIDFKLYNTLTDLQADTNGWKICDYDDIGIGGFRDCAPTAETTVGLQWNSITNVNGKKVKYYILKN